LPSNVHITSFSFIQEIQQDLKIEGSEILFRQLDAKKRMPRVGLETCVRILFLKYDLQYGMVKEL